MFERRVWQDVSRKQTPGELQPQDMAAETAKLYAMNTRFLFRVVLPAVVALPLGFVGLALAAENEPTVPGPLLMLFSPGLKLAELIAPGEHGSLGATFGWFLRVGIVANAAYYFVIFALLAYLVSRRRTAL